MSYLNKLVKVKWTDHCSMETNRWRDYDLIKQLKPMIMTSVGYVIKQTKSYIIIVATKSEYETATGEMLIVKGNIKSIKEIH